jgi:outer membrane protein assembly factor BamB
MFPLLAVLLAVWPSVWAGGDWIQWGGPNREFKVEATGLAEEWPEEGPPKLWSREIGEGYSAVLAQGRTLYTMHRSGKEEGVIALDARTGRTLWEYRYAAEPLESQDLGYGKGPNATPLIVDDAIYTIGFTSKLHALNKETGKLLWSHDLVQEFEGKVQAFGYSASPLAFSRMVVVLVGGPRHGAVGFDRVDGSVAWKAPPLDISYASPITIQVGGEEQLVFMTSTEVVGVGLKDGEIKWRHPHENQYKNNCAGPWWSEDGLLFVSSQGDVGGQTLRLAHRDGRTIVQQIAVNPKMNIFHYSAIRLGDYIYGGSRSFFAAHNVKTGETAWRHRGLAEANAIYAGNRMILLDQEGWLALATVSPEGITVHSEHKLLEKWAWTAPTLKGTTLYVRGGGKIMALDLAVREKKSKP